MSELRFSIDWHSRNDADPYFGETTANLRIMLDDTCLTQNVDIWSRTTRDQVLVSVYPLAMWLASSWWRLHYEVLPSAMGRLPLPDWRLAHEMTAANSGYVWPLIAFSTDRRSMNVWAEPSPSDPEHSVRYLTGINAPSLVPMKVFSYACGELIENVLARLNATGHSDSELAQLWTLIQADSVDAVELQKRRIEAQFGFDPEECPTDLLCQFIEIERDKGEDVLAELAAVRSWHEGRSAWSIRELFEAPGIDARFDLPKLSSHLVPGEPWQQAKSDAQYFRRAIGVGDGPLTNKKLSELLGADVSSLIEPLVERRRAAAVAGRISGHRVRIVPRKRHPIARRFELARIIGGYSDSVLRDGNSWIASTDSGTARQKYQRAFAAELLCPVKPLADYLGGDFSDGAIEDAATQFEVSDQTVIAQLMNNHFLPSTVASFGPPYSMVA